MRRSPTVIVIASTQPETIADFTNRVGDAWKIGRRDIGDGVLIAVAVKDRRVWISVARALGMKVIAEGVDGRFGRAGAAEVELAKVPKGWPAEDIAASRGALEDVFREITRSAQGGRA